MLNAHEVKKMFETDEIEVIYHKNGDLLDVFDFQSWINQPLQDLAEKVFLEGGIK